MSKSLKKRYLFAVYAVVAAIAIVTALLAFSRGADEWQSLLLNITTELLGVVLIFSLVNVIFLVDDWDLSERVKELIQKLSDPSAKDFFKSPPNQDNLQRYLQDTKRIDVLGVTLTVTLNKNVNHFLRRLSSGSDIRIVIIYPNEKNLLAAAARSETGNPDYFRRRLEASLNDLEFLYAAWDNGKKAHPGKTGELKIGLLPYTPSFGIFHFDSGTNEGVMAIEIYPHHTGYDLPPTFYLSKQNDVYWYNYFSEQFEEMWKRTTPWQPGMGVDASSISENV